MSNSYNIYTLHGDEIIVVKNIGAKNNTIRLSYNDKVYEEMTLSPGKEFQIKSLKDISLQLSMQLDCEIRNILTSHSVKIFFKRKAEHPFTFNCDVEHCSNIKLEKNKSLAIEKYNSIEVTEYCNEKYSASSGRYCYSCFTRRVETKNDDARQLSYYFYKNNSILNVRKLEVAESEMRSYLRWCLGLAEVKPLVPAAVDPKPIEEIPKPTKGIEPMSDLKQRGINGATRAAGRQLVKMINVPMAAAIATFFKTDIKHAEEFLESDLGKALTGSSTSLALSVLPNVKGVPQVLVQELQEEAVANVITTFADFVTDPARQIVAKFFSTEQETPALDNIPFVKAVVEVPQVQTQAVEN